jgi:hypothetical protein
MLDWEVAEERLHEASVAAIKKFAGEHSDELVCFFAFDSEPRYGYVMYCLPSTLFRTT